MQARISVGEHPYTAVALPRNEKKLFIRSLFFIVQTRANIDRMKLDKMETSRKEIKDCSKAPTMVFKPTMRQ